MHYYQIPPPPELAPFLRYFWVFENPEDDGAIKKYKVMADGGPGFVLQSDPVFYDHRQQLLPSFFLYGQSTANTINSSLGSFRNIGCVFRPEAIKSVFGIDAHEMTDQVVDMKQITSQVLPETLSTENITDCVGALSRWLVSLVHTNEHRSGKQAAYMADRIIAHPHAKSLKDLQSELGISERSLQRVFMNHIGISPKLFVRICRFQSSLNWLRQQQYNKLSDISYDHGYADQSHFIREFREFVGVSPNAYLKLATEIVDNYPEWKE